MLGLFVPRLARWLSERLYAPGRNLLGLAAFSVVALALLALFLPYLGVLPMAVFVALTTTSFFTSQHPERGHRVAPAGHGAQFQGVGLQRRLRGHRRASLRSSPRPGLVNPPGLVRGQVQAGAFRTAFAWLPGYLVLGLVLAALLCLPRLRRRERVVDGGDRGDQREAGTPSFSGRGRSGRTR